MYDGFEQRVEKNRCDRLLGCMDPQLVNHLVDEPLELDSKCEAIFEDREEESS